MEIRINETKELKELIATGNNGIEWTQDLLGNHNALKYNRDTDEYEMSQYDFDWWENYITTSEADEAAVEELAEELGIDSQDIWVRINNNMYHDLSQEHRVIQSTLDEIREENE